MQPGGPGREDLGTLLRAAAARRTWRRGSGDCGGEEGGPGARSVRRRRGATAALTRNPTWTRNRTLTPTQGPVLLFSDLGLGP